MKKIARYLLLAIFVLSAYTGSSQSKNLYIRDSLLKIDSKNLSPESYYDVLTEIANTFVYTSEADSVLKYSQAMLKIGDHLRRDSLIGYAFGYIGTAYGITTDISACFENYFRGLEILEKGNHTQKANFIHKQIGVTYRELKDYDSAIKYLVKASKNLKKVGILPNRVYTNLAESYINLGKLDSALVYAQKAKQSCNPVDDPYGHARTIYLLGSIYMKRKEIGIGKGYLDDCIKFCNREKIYTPLQTSYIELANYEYENRNIIAAKNYALHSLKTQNKKQLVEIPIYELLQKIYIKENKKDSVIFYNQYLSNLQNEVYDENLFNQLQIYKINEFLRQKDLKSKKEQELVKYKSRIQYSLILLGLIFIGLLTILFSKSALATHKSIQYFTILMTLILFEFINLVLHPMLTKITNHSPTIMLAIMTVIAFLLLPLREKLNNWLLQFMLLTNKGARIEYAKKYLNR